MADLEFHDNTMKVLAAMDTKVMAVLEECAGELESQVKRNSRVDNGETKNSWHHKTMKHGDDFMAIIGSTKINAVWEEFGTGEHALEGKGRKGAWYVPVDGYSGTKKPTYNGKVIIIKGKDGQEFYKTNGKKPSRAFWNAYKSLKNKLIRRIQNSVKGM